MKKIEGKFTSVLLAILLVLACWNPILPKVNGAEETMQSPPSNSTTSFKNESMATDSPNTNENTGIEIANSELNYEIPETIRVGDTISVSCNQQIMDDKYIYQWEVSPDGINNWVEIPGEVQKNHTCMLAHLGHFLRVKVMRFWGDNEPTYTNVSKMIIPAMPIISEAQIQGEGYVGEKLTLTFSIQNIELDPAREVKIIWERQRSGDDAWITIDKASDTKYTLQLADQGCNVRARIVPYDLNETGVNAVATTPIKVAPGMAYYVSVDGDDNNSGSILHPFKDWNYALTVIHKQINDPQLPEGPIYVYLRGGVYEQYYRLRIGIQGEHNKSGTEKNRIIIQNYNQEKVRIMNGKQIDFSKAVLMSESPNQYDKELCNSLIDPLARQRLMKLDLASIGITEIPELEDYGFGVQGEEFQPMEIFINGKGMQLARWPNEDSSDLCKITNSTYTKANTPFTLNYRDDSGRTSQWNQYLTDIFVGGNMGNDWAKVHHKVSVLDKKEKKVVSVGGTPYKPQKNQKIYFFNVFQEIDQPGEYYIDRPNKILYFYPPCLPGDQNVSMSISVGTTEMVELTDAHDISIFGLDFDTCRNTIVKSFSINRVEIDSCSFSLGASNAITLDGINSSVYRCHIYEMGKGGVIVKGGDRKTLTPANNEIWGNRIHSFNRIYESSAPAVSVSGVKQTIAYNTIYDAPHTMIQLVGANDTLIEHNEIYNGVQKASDIGAIYQGRKVYELGTTIRYNLFHDIGNKNGGYGQQSIFVDDGGAGAYIYGNIFDRGTLPPSQGGKSKTSHVIKTNSGQYNCIKNNIFIDAPSVFNFLDWSIITDPIEQVDWWLWVNDAGRKDNKIWETLTNTGWGSDTWIDHYKDTNWETLSTMFTQEQHENIPSLSINRLSYAQKYAPYNTNKVLDNILIGITEGGEAGSIGGPITHSGNKRMSMDELQDLFPRYPYDGIDASNVAYTINTQKANELIKDFPDIYGFGADVLPVGQIPTVSGMSIEKKDNLLTAKYSFSAIGVEGVSDIVWYLSDSQDGQVTYNATGKIGKELLIDNSYAGKFVRYEIVPHDRNGFYGKKYVSPSIYIEK